MIRPGDMDAASMNARKKEKKKQLTQAIKPISLSGWVALKDHWLAWIKTNEWSLNINDYAIAHGYPPYKFKKWAKESEVFQEGLEMALYICSQRRDRYMQQEQKFYMQVLKQLPQYDPDYADYEREIKAQEEAVSKGIINLVLPDVKRTEELDNFIKTKQESE